MKSPTMNSVDGGMISLAEMQVSASLNAAVALVELRQVYANDEARPIEAIYTFPLPLEAVLLAVDVRIAGKALTGQVVGKSKAEAKYENAVADGNAAVMLEESEPGSYTMNVGNLKSGEKAEVVIRYAILLRWEQGLLRFTLPTTIAPRYGNPLARGQRPHQVPAVSPLAEQPLQLSVSIDSSIGIESVTSPTHKLRIVKSEDGCHAVEAGNASADRDFVLLVERQARDAASLVVAADGEKHVALICAQANTSEAAVSRPRSVKIVLDCSGSMAGDSLSKALEAVSEALRSLGPNDEFSLTAFGSNFVNFSRRVIVSEPRTIKAALQWVASRSADMGGTEMAQAVAAAIALSGGNDSSDILLVTDGEITDPATIGELCKKARHRIFAVGIGASPAASGLNEMVNATGGGAVFVTPNEDVQAAIRTQFRRIAQPQMHVEAQWPLAFDWSCMGFGPAFEGDTIHLFAGLPIAPSGPAALILNAATGSKTRIEAAISEGIDAVITQELPRIAAAFRIRNAQSLSQDVPSEIQELAIRYQLITPWTNFILVHERAEGEKTNGMPQVRAVAHMLAAGWGGTGTVHSMARAASVSKPRFQRSMRVAASHGGSSWPMDLDEKLVNIPAFLRNQSDDPPMQVAQPSAPYGMELDEDSVLNIPAFKRQQEKFTWDASPASTPSEFVERLNERFDRMGPAGIAPQTFAGQDALVLASLPTNLVADLKSLVDAGWEARQVLLAFWMAFQDSGAGAQMSRGQRREILRAGGLGIPDALVAWMRVAMEFMTEETWIWSPGDPPARTATALIESAQAA